MEAPRIDPVPNPAPKAGPARVLPNRVPVVDGWVVDPKSDPTGFCGCCGWVDCPKNEVVGCIVLVKVCAAGCDCPKSVGGEMMLVPVVVPVAGAPKILEGGLFPNSGFEDEVEVPKGPPPCAGVVVVLPPKRPVVGCVVAFVAPNSPPVEGCRCVLVVDPNRFPPNCWGCTVVDPKPPADCCCDCCVFVPPNRLPPAG